MLIVRDKKSKKYFWYALIFIIIGTALLFAKNLPNDENAANFITILGAGSCILAVWFYYKSLRFTMDTIIKPAFKKAFSRVSKRFKEAINKVKKKLGFSDNPFKMKGKDTFNFIFPSFGRKKGKQREFGKDRIKWNEDPGNPWKIRYIFTKYIVKRVKKGAPFKSSRTALEVKDTFVECPYPEIFQLYTVSRYAPPDTGKEAVSDEAVEEAMEKLIKS